MRLFAVYLAACILLGLTQWIDDTFGQPSIDQIVYHLQYADVIAVRMSRIFWGTFAAEVVLFPTLVAAGLTALHALLARGRPHWNRHLGLRAVPRAALLAGMISLPMQFSAFTYLRDSLGADDFSGDYIDPKIVRIAKDAARPRNLVLIYMESIEETYSDPSLFGRDLLAPLHQLDGRSFDRYLPVPGTNWTIAAMVATQCGVPLRVYSESDVRQDPSGRTYLPGATCLGDILRAKGYRNVFMGGASLSFSGKGVFLRDHGYAKTFGREEWIAQGAQGLDLNDWGVYDSHLFEGARAELKALHDSGQPFNLTLLTMNTHNPYGYFGPGCKGRGAQDFEGLVACSAQQVREFIDFARTSGYLEDTVFVVIGDHPAVPNPVWHKLRDVPERRIFNRFYGPHLPAPNRAGVVPFDLFPSMLELLGFHVAGGRLGLGYAGFNHPTLAPPADRGRAVTTSALRASTVYRALWEVR